MKDAASEGKRRVFSWRVCLSVAVILLSLIQLELTPGQGRGLAAGGAPAKSTSKASPAQSQGSWSAPFTIGVVGIHAALLNNGQVLFWTYDVPVGSGASPTKLWNPTTNAVTTVMLPFTADIFCSGTTMLSDGKLLVIGGKNDSVPGEHGGIINTTIFDPSTNEWSAAQPLNYARWYPGAVELQDGTVLAVSGSNMQGTELIPQIEQYNETANTWTVLPPSANIPSNVTVYPRLILLPTGNIFEAGFSQLTQMFNPTTNTWSNVGNMNIGVREYGSSVLLPGLEKVLTAGGRQTTGLSGYATNTAEEIDFSQTNPQWSYIAPMNYQRENLNLVLLPDGTLLAVGGNEGSNAKGGSGGVYANPVFQAELFNPTAGTWTVMAAQQVQRAYHSTALLLPDGRVVSAGSDYGSQPNTIEVFSPPYLSEGTRPTITSSPASITYGQQFTITTPNASSITSVALLKAEATTHATRFDARYVSLTYTLGNGVITATAPPSAYYAPPAYYLLSVVNSNGIPAVMPFIQVTPN